MQYGFKTIYKKSYTSFKISTVVRPNSGCLIVFTHYHVEPSSGGKGGGVFFTQVPCFLSDKLLHNVTDSEQMVCSRAKISAVDGMLVNLRSLLDGYCS